MIVRVFTPPVTDVRFVLAHVVGLADPVRRAEVLGDIDEESVDAVLDGAARFAEERLAPLNATGDLHGCVRNADGSVTTPPGFAQAYADYCADGWPSLRAPTEFGGQALAQVLALSVAHFSVAANLSLTTYIGLTAGAIEAILVAGSEEQKARFVPNLVYGKWTGTMNLTEPHCGTDLGMIRTMARPNDDGSWSITGTKIFITGGEHDMAENIVHLVLARTPDAPAGVKGLSLFIVPKKHVDGANAGTPNQVHCSAIEHKMGIRGSATCTMQYERARGELLGQVNRGLTAMFVMMNYARQGTGMQNISLAEAACQRAIAYAQDRRQGRAVTLPPQPGVEADPIIHHADVRRMLTECRAWIEGGRALGLWLGSQLDRQKRTSAEERARAAGLLALLTPVFKGFGSDIGFHCTVLSQQVFGGAGFVTQTGIEQFVRDARIAMIYEGANGIQAMDLVTRKIRAEDGRAFADFIDIVATEIAETPASIAPLARAMQDAINDLQASVAAILAMDEDEAGASAYPLMQVFGHVALGLMWLKMAGAAQKESAGSAQFREAKTATAHFFMSQLLPATASLRQRIAQSARSVLPAAAFA